MIFKMVRAVGIRLIGHVVEARMACWSFCVLERSMQTVLRHPRAGYVSPGVSIIWRTGEAGSCIAKPLLIVLSNSLGFPDGPGSSAGICPSAFSCGHGQETINIRVILISRGYRQCRSEFANAKGYLLFTYGLFLRPIVIPLATKSNDSKFTPAS